MKPISLIFLLFTFFQVSCKSPEKAPMSSAKRAEEAAAAPALPRLKSAEMVYRDSKNQKVAHSEIEETRTGVLVVFETDNLGKGQYQIYLESGCGKGASKVGENLPLKEITVSGDSYSTEFRLDGYTLNAGDEKALGQKALTIYRSNRKSEPVGCGVISPPES